MLVWIGLDACIQLFACMGKPQMKVIVDDNNFNIPYCLKLNEYRRRLSNAVNVDMEDVMPIDDLKTSMVKAMLSSLFMKPLKKGNEEGESKYATLGRRLDKPTLRTFWLFLQKENSFSAEPESLYVPGLVKRIKKNHVRDSSDGVIIVKENNTKTATPIEVKGRVSINTFHRTVARFNRKHGLSDMPGLGSEASGARMYNISDDDEHLLGLVPEYHDLFQVLHHAYTYGTNSCFYLISSHRALMYIVKINFSEDFLDSYEAVTDWLYTNTLEQFYTQGNEVPNVWPAVKDALKDPRFESLKITEHGFQCYIGL